MHVHVQVHVLVHARRMHNERLRCTHAHAFCAVSCWPGANSDVSGKKMRRSGRKYREAHLDAAVKNSSSVSNHSLLASSVRRRQQSALATARPRGRTAMRFFERRARSCASLTGCRCRHRSLTLRSPRLRCSLSPRQAPEGTTWRRDCRPFCEVRGSGRGTAGRRTNARRLGLVAG